MLLRETLLGRYRIVRLLGDGGFGEVYLAEDTLIQRNVAVKVIKPQQSPTKLQEAMRLFQREMKAIAQLDHPHILPLYDFGEATVNGTKYAFMVMPYCKDGTLETWLDERKDKHFPFPSLHDVAQILSQAAEALQQAHDHPDTILHLDVKPANFLIRQNKENPNCPYLLLADFGVAKFVDASGGFSTTVRGSIEYMPSEQSRSNPQCASDQYALALMIYKILTYQLPFKGDYAQLLYQHLEVLAKPPSTLNPHIPPEIDAVILKALAKDYEERYPTIIAFADAFKEALVNNASTRVILSISKTEAETGGSYPIRLADGRLITVAIPARVQNGKEIRQEGLGVPVYNGGPNPALIITVTVKPESESERKITSQLQSLEREIQALRAKPPADTKLAQQIQQLSKEIAALQTQATNEDQNIAAQLQKLAKDVAALQSSPNGNQNVLKQLQQLSQNVSALVPSNNSPIVTKQLQKISQDIAKLQPIQNGNDVWTCSTFIVCILLVVLIITSGFGLYYGFQAYNYFSNIQSTIYSNTVATSIATNTYPSYLPGNETLTLYDPLDGSSNKYQWNTTGSCSFANRAYNVNISQQNEYNDCVASATNFSNFAFEVDMTITKGDCGGVIFRADSTNYKYYFLSICQDGTFGFFKYKSNTSPVSDTLINFSNSISYINKGLNHANIIAVVANKSNLMLFANQHQLGTVTDNTYTQGQIGLLANSYSSSSTNVSYTNAKVWTL